MAKVDLSTIKNWFKTGLKPTQQQFWNTWDSFWHKDDEISQTNIENLTADLGDKADTDAENLTPQNVTSWKEKLGVTSQTGGGDMYKSDYDPLSRKEPVAFFTDLDDYYTKTESDANFEPIITQKKSAFNQNFGFGENDVARGNHTHEYKTVAGNEITGTGDIPIDEEVVRLKQQYHDLELDHTFTQKDFNQAILDFVKQRIKVKKTVYNSEIQGIRDGVNHEFSIEEKYVPGSLEVHYNGKMMTKGNDGDFVENNPGTTNNGIVINHKVQAGDNLIFKYLKLED